MKLIADSGGTKTDWRLIDNQNNITSYATEGLNPVYKSPSVLLDIIQTQLISNPTIISNTITEIYFYGAGCMEFENADGIKQVLGTVFPQAKVEVYSDILGSARATSGSQKGIVAILGTGANVCVYSNHTITYRRSGLGYIIGDEGSGAHLGKTLIKRLLDEELSAELTEKIYSKYDLTKSSIIDIIYRQPNANMFFSSFSKFIFQLRHKPEIQKIIVDCFTAFFETHITRIENYSSYTIHFTGSVAFYFSDYIKNIARNYQIPVGIILEKPIAGLALYHQESN